ncbi:MAG TPA: hypothetical protein VMS86_11955 [Thermoanaerobaculia bacterium]|nr:hypothetical protein [Thermoanaerobaculia bacterium]
MTALPRALLAGVLMTAAAFGGAQPPAAPAAPAQAPADAAAAAAEPLPSVAAVLDRYVEALGGEEAIRGHRSVTWRGTFSMPGQGLEGDLTLQASAPNLFRLDVTAEGLGTISQGYDGKIGWSDNMMTGPTLTRGAELELVAIQSDFYVDLHYAEHYPAMKVVARESFDGEPCLKLAVTTPGGLEMFPYFSVASGLLVGFEGDLPTAMGEVWVRTSIGGYRELDGRLYPTENQQEVMGTRQVITLLEADFTDLDPSVFALPPAIETLVGEAPKQQ